MPATSTSSARMSGERQRSGSASIPEISTTRAVRALSFEARQVLAAHRPANRRGRATARRHARSLVAPAGPREEASAQRDDRRRRSAPGRRRLIAAAPAAACGRRSGGICSSVRNPGSRLAHAGAGRSHRVFRLIGRWNGAYNLTALREPRAMVVSSPARLPCRRRAARRRLADRRRRRDARRRQRRRTAGGGHRWL